FLAGGNLHRDLGIGFAEGCDQRLQQDRHYCARHREAQQSGWPLSQITRDLAGGDEFLEGGPGTQQESLARFSQAYAARRADEKTAANARLECTHRLADRGRSHPRSAAALRKLRCRATLRNASTPSSAPCLTVKFCFMAHQDYQE